MNRSFLTSLVAAGISAGIAALVPASARAGDGFAAFDGIDTSARIVGDRQVEVTTRMMDGVGAMTPRNGMTGLSGAAADMVGASLWVGTGGNHVANTTAGTEYRGDQFNGLFGADWAVQPWLIIGVAFGGEQRSFDTFFNEGKFRGSGVSIAPYTVVRLDTNFFLDASFSYARLFNDIERNDFAFHPTVFGEYESNRYIGTVNLHGVWNIDNWRLGVQLGYLHVHQDDDGYDQFGGCEPFDCESVPANSVDLGQLRGGGRIGYAFGDFTPYLIGRLDYNVINPTSFGVQLKDRFGGFVGAGLRWNITRTIAAVAQGNTIVGRDHATDYGGYATLRFSW